LTGNYNQGNKLYLNDGSGGFSATGAAVGSETDFTISVVLGDVDADGDLDLVAGNSGQTNKLYRNVTYRTSGQVVASLSVNTGEVVSAAALTATDTVNTATTRNTSIDYYLSNDGGAHWVRAYPGIVVIFPAPGTDLRWKAEFSSLSPVITPVLHQVFIDPDTDVDGIANAVDPDDDGDGLFDIVESQLGSDPLVFDDQTPGLTGTNIDSDGDGVSDYYEINILGTDPYDPGDVTQISAGPLGDINGDGVFNVGDLVVLQRMLLDLE
jgi:hypothetical protein